MRVRDRCRLVPRCVCHAAVIRAAFTGSLALLALGSCSRVRAPAPRPAMVVAFTGNMLGHLEPCGCSDRETGGLPRRMAYLDRLRRQHEAALFVDNGGLVQGTSPQEQMKLETALYALDEMGYTAVNLGREELGFGVDYLRSLAAGTARLSFVSANFRRTDLDPLADDPDWPAKHFVVTETEIAKTRYRVAVSGVISERFAPELARLAPQGRVHPPLEVVRRLMPRLEAESDFVVLLAQMPAQEATTLARAVEGLDMIVCGHGRNVPDEIRLAEQGGSSPRLFDSGDRGRYVGTLTLVPAGAGKLDSRRFEFEIIDRAFARSEPIQQLILDYRFMLREEGLLRRLADLAGPPPGEEYLGSEACGACHEEDLSIWRRTKHAHAYETLIKLGENKEFDPECVKCHVVGLGFRTGFASHEDTPRLANVGCEADACHGAGREHAEEPAKPYNKSSAEHCRQCHNPDHSTHFDFDRDWPKIKHGMKKQRVACSVLRKGCEQ